MTARTRITGGKWVLGMLLTQEHAGILPNQSNPPKLTLLARPPMIPHGPDVPPLHPWLSPEGAPKRESVVWRFSMIDILKITLMVFLLTVQYLSSGGIPPSIKSAPVKLRILNFATMYMLN